MKEEGGGVTQGRRGVGGVEGGGGEGGGYWGTWGRELMKEGRNERRGRSSASIWFLDKHSSGVHLSCG